MTGNLILSVRCVNQFEASARRARKSLSDLWNVIDKNREFRLVSGPGQWPDKFSLLNRYVRTGLEPPYILND